MNIRALIKEHSVLSYFALTFAISWGGVIALGSPSGMPAPSEEAAKLWPIVYLPYFIGPILSSLLLTGLIDGREGYRALRTRFTKWRVGARWYAVALLTAPLLIVAILFVLSLTSSVYLPAIVTTEDKVGLVITGIMIGLVFGGLMEELGWTGFAVPKLRERNGVFATGLIVGFLWGIWHFLPTFWACGDSNGVLSLDLLIPPCVFYALVLPTYRVLMVWVYDRTSSLLVAILMHAALTANTITILVPAEEVTPLVTYYIIFTAALWIVIAGVAATDHWRLTRQPLERSRDTRAEPSEAATQ
ncbi:MAG TPA: type II CAAX endopeptidase family protein [Thermoplasmata archaeon]